jgi:hypothetical protein
MSAFHSTPEARERWVLSDWDTGAATRWKSVPPARSGASTFRFRSRPRARSACKSAGLSSPTAIRNKPSPMPDAARASAEMRPWVVDAGWVMVVLVSPRLAVIDSRRQLSTTRQAASRSPLTSKDTMAPPLACCRIASSCWGCEASPG